MKVRQLVLVTSFQIFCQNKYCFFRIVGKLSLKKEIPKLRYNNRKSCNNNNNLYYKNVISVCIYFCLMSDHNA